MWDKTVSFVEMISAGRKANSFAVRVAAKEITSLILDEERLRAERSDRKSWKSRVTGLEEHAPPAAEGSSNRRRERRQGNEDDDAEYKLALEASKYQEEEDRKKREGRGNEDDDDDLAKAIKLSQEEEERRRRELEEQNATSLFDLDPTPPAQAQPTGFNQGYQQGNQVDFFANPVEQPMQMQPTGYNMQNFQQPMQTGYQGFGFQQTGMGMDPYGQQNMQQFQPQATGYNPYAQQQMMQQQQQQQQQQLQQEPAPQAGSNNPWATNQQQQNLKPMVTGSNNPFAQQAQTARPQTTFNTMSSLTPLPEQKTLSTFSQPAQIQPQQQQMQLQSNMPRREMNEHESKLNALLATGDGLDTYGNAGELRIPAQHTAPGMFMNSAGSGAARLTAEQTGNPYLRQQFTGMPTVSYGAQPGMNGQQASNNPFGAQQAQKPNQGQDLIQF